jgi:ankyrin repeat protein
MIRSGRSRALYYALAAGSLLTAIAAWNLVSIRNRSLLSAALIEGVKSKDRIRVEELLKAGADPDAESETQNWSSASISELLRSILGKRRSSFTRWSALRLAVIGGDVEMAKLLLRSGARNVNTRGRSIAERRETLLMSAIYLRDLGLVRMLLDRGADIHTRDWIESTPAHYAVYSENPQILELLLSRGADPQAADEQNRTLLQGAAGSKKGAELIRILLKWRADPNRKGQAGWLPIHVAAMHGREEAVRTLVAAGSQLNAKTNYGVTPLQSAQKRSRLGVVRILKDAGAK